MSTDDEDFENDASLFKEPEDFYQREMPPTFVDYTLGDGRRLNLRLVGHNPLWVRSPNTVSRIHGRLTCSRVTCYGMRDVLPLNTWKSMLSTWSRTSVYWSWELEQGFRASFLL